MGFFSSNKKKQEEAPSTTKPTVELTNCPICQQNTFQKVNYFFYLKDSGIKISETAIFNQEKQDCTPQVGDNTGFCKNCGGIIRGLIFLQNTESNKKAMEVIVAECNRAFIKTFLEIRDELKSGKKQIDLKKILDNYKTENKNVLEEWNMRTHLILALHGAGMKFSTETNTQLEDLIQKYKNILPFVKIIMDLGTIPNSDNKYKENIDTFIKALGKFIA